MTSISVDGANFCFCRQELALDERGGQLYLDVVNHWQTAD
jgi:hypothetical protein